MGTLEIYFYITFSQQKTKTIHFGFVHFSLPYAFTMRAGRTHVSCGCFRNLHFANRKRKLKRYGTKGLFQPAEICIYQRGQGLCKSRGGRPALPVPKGPNGLCGRKATFEEEEAVESQ